MPLHPVLQPADAALPLVFTRAEALALGLSRHVIARRLRRGDWHLLRDGVYCATAAWDAAGLRERHLLLSAAVVRRCRGAVVSHESAAAAHGWPLPLGGAGDVWTTVPPAPVPVPVHPPAPAAAAPAAAPVAAPGSSAPAIASAGVGTGVGVVRPSTRRRDGLRQQVAPLPPGDVVRLTRWGVDATSGARTVADCLRHAPLAHAIAVADAAAARVPRASVAEVLARQASWPYAARGGHALSLVDPRRESWLESVGAVGLWTRGVPLPEAQAVVEDARGRFIGRVDHLWRTEGVVGEADGRLKYAVDGARSVEEAQRRLVEEKEREDRMRSAGLEVVRYGLAELRDLDGLVRAWCTARERGGAGRVRARIRCTSWPVTWPAPVR